MAGVPGQEGHRSPTDGAARARRSSNRARRVTLLFVDHRHRAAHRLRQHRQPAAGARRESHDGDGRAALARRDAPAADRAGAHRVGAARDARRRRRARRRALDARRHHGDAAGAASPRRWSFTLSGPVLAVHGARLAGNGPAVRHRAGAAEHAARSRDRAAQQLGQALGQPRRRALSHEARHRADRAVDGAAHLGGPVHQEPAQHQPRRSRHQHRQHGDVRHLAGAQRLRLDARASRSTAASRKRSPRFPA